MTEILKITDGTNEVTLIGSGSAFRVQEHEPAVPQAKGGGTWHDPALGDGRFLTGWQWQNNIDGYTLFLRSSVSQNQAAADLRSLIHLLMQAIYYRTSRRPGVAPVYVQRKADEASNAEYALIENWHLPGYNSPFGEFFHRFRMRGLRLALEQGHWSENPPGTGTTAAVAAGETYNGTEYGVQTPTTADVVFVANHRVPQNITHKFNYDASATSFSNLTTTIFPSSPAVGDIAYFGISTAVADSGPFSNLIFDITQAGTGTIGLDWEYWNGSAWDSLLDALAITDHTEDFSLAGSLPAAWQPPTNWATTSVNGVTGWWVRVRIESISGYTRPTVSQIYSATWPYVEILSDQVAGDLPALAHLRANQYIWTGSGSYGLIAGLKSVTGAEDFTAYLNLSDGHNPSGITVTPRSGASFTNEVQAAAGRAITYTPPGGLGSFDDLLIADVALGESIISSFAGEYRVFLRYRKTGTAYQVRLGLGYSGGTGSPAALLGDKKNLLTDTGNWIVDLGRFSLPLGGYGIAAGNSVFTQFLKLYFSGPEGGSQIWFYDLILIPADEWIGEATGLATVTHIDSIGNPRVPVRAYTTKADDTGYTPLKLKTNGPAILQANATQRLWTLSYDLAASNGEIQARPWEHATQLRIQRNQRYLAPRGDS